MDRVALLRWFWGAQRGLMGGDTVERFDEWYLEQYAIEGQA